MHPHVPVYERLGTEARTMLHLPLIPAVSTVPRAIARIHVQVTGAAARRARGAGRHEMVRTARPTLPERPRPDMLVPAADAALRAHARHAGALHARLALRAPPRPAAATVAHARLARVGFQLVRGTTGRASHGRHRGRHHMRWRPLSWLGRHSRDPSPLGPASGLVLVALLLRASVAHPLQLLRRVRRVRRPAALAARHLTVYGRGRTCGSRWRQRAQAELRAVGARTLVWRGLSDRRSRSHTSWRGLSDGLSRWHE